MQSRNSPFSRNATQRISSALALPEVRIFWFLLPMLLAVLGLVFIDLPVPAALRNLAIIGLLLAIGGVVFLASYRLARLNYDTKAERNELRNIIETVNDALLVYDKDFVVTFFNPAAEKLFAVTASDIIGTEISPKFAEEPSRRLLAQVVFPTLAPTLVYLSKAGQYPQVVDISFDDPLLELRVTTAPVIDESGSTIAFMKIIANRTQEVSLIKSKNEFITVASHQLRTPVTGIVWALESLEQDPAIPASAKDLVGQASVTAHKIQNIVEDLLSIAKIEEGHYGYQLQSLEIVAFLENILAHAMPQVQHAGLKLYFERPAEALAPAMADAEKLSMVVANLVDNAVRYNVEHGQITVRARRFERDPRYAVISVQDTGIGIPPEEIRHIFTKFFRGTNATKFQTDGSGLGLWIARNIVRAHGGEMWAESELNRGTTFLFTLPIDATVVPTNEAANASVTV